MISENAKFELVALEGGLFSLRMKQNKETFHPGIGPQKEAEILHVAQQRLVERAQRQGSFVLWDIGLGAAANSIAAIQALKDLDIELSIHSFDLSLDPLRFALANAESLPYIVPYREQLEILMQKGSVALGAKFHWYFHEGDFRDLMKGDLPAPDAVFYDPYSPKQNQEMWTLEHLRQLRARLTKPCLLTNYTRSTVVRVTFLLAGFYAGIGALIGKKEETTLFSNDLSLLERPLDARWLEKRVKISHSATPLRSGSFEIAPIQAEDYAALEQHPQFRRDLQ